MYNDSSIELLMNRIAWNDAVAPTNITLTSENKEGVSGRFFDSFHSLVTVENVFACIPNLDVTNETLNEVLLKMKKDCAIEVLNRVLNVNPKAYRANYQENGRNVTSLGYAADYTTIISENSSLFDDAIGFSMANRALQLFLTTKRSNLEETTISMSYEQLKVEKEGFFSQYGQVIAKGTFHKFEGAIIEIINILFPTETFDIKTLKGVNVW